jgi:hypothetical protein
VAKENEGKKHTEVLESRGEGTSIAVVLASETLTLLYEDIQFRSENIKHANLWRRISGGRRARWSM